MIAVIADDLTGAAELAGVAHRFGLRSEIHTQGVQQVRPGEGDVIAIDTDSRWCDGVEAASRVAHAAEQLSALPITWVYKKVDSILRGNIAAEMAALMTVLHKRRGILSPANPSLDRTIIAGQYHIAGRLLHETALGRSTGHPAGTSDVLELLAVSGAEEVRLGSKGGPITDMGTTICDCDSAADCDSWATQVDDNTLAAGGADFFAAGLRVRGSGTIDAACDVRAAGLQSAGCTRLIVCGSYCQGSRAAIAAWQAAGGAVSQMPDELFADSGGSDADSIRNWASRTAAMLTDCGVVVVATGGDYVENAADRVSSQMARLVEAVLAGAGVDHLCIEGGATAAAVLRRMGWRQLCVKDELASGVVTAEAFGMARPRITFKPGSYAWPAKLMELNGCRNA